MGLVDVVLNSGKVVAALLELVGTDGEEVSSGKRFGEVRHKEGHHGDVERKDGLDAVSYKEGRVPGGFAGSNAVSPKNVGCRSWPLSDVALAGFDEGFADGAVLAFDDAIGVGIVR